MMDDYEYYSTLLKRFKPSLITANPQTVEEKAQFIFDIFQKEPQVAVGVFVYGLMQTDLFKGAFPNLPEPPALKKIFDIFATPGVPDRFNKILDEKGIGHRWGPKP